MRSVCYFLALALAACLGPRVSNTNGDGDSDSKCANCEGGTGTYYCAECLRKAQEGDDMDGYE